LYDRGFCFGKDFTWFLTKKNFIFEKKEFFFFFFENKFFFGQKPGKILTKKNPLSSGVGYPGVQGALHLEPLFGETAHSHFSGRQRRPYSHFSECRRRPKPFLEKQFNATSEDAEGARNHFFFPPAAGSVEMCISTFSHKKTPNFFSPAAGTVEMCITGIFFTQKKTQIFSACGGSVKMCITGTILTQKNTLKFVFNSHSHFQDITICTSFQKVISHHCLSYNWTLHLELKFYFFVVITTYLSQKGSLSQNI
jgi:hypothetical protein